MTESFPSFSGLNCSEIKQRVTTPSARKLVTETTHSFDSWNGQIGIALEWAVLEIINNHSSPNLRPGKLSYLNHQLFKGTKFFVQWMLNHL